MTYKKALQIIYSQEKFGSKPGLERIGKLLNAAGNPQNKLRFIHVAGTNGKGSVCYMIASVLKTSGYKTGLFISPSISDFREKIQINGKMIPQKKFAESIIFFNAHMKNPEFTKDPPTEFELTLAVAFKFFSDEKCDAVVLEAGIGGKLDATNIIKEPLVSVITSVSEDHTNILGSTVEKIAQEKFGIIKPFCPTVLASNQKESVKKIASEICALKKSKLIIANKTMIKNPEFSLKKGISFIYENTKIEANLCGTYQLENIAVVLSALEIIDKELKIPLKSIKKGLKKVFAPCRFEIVKINPTVILDAAHNPAGAQALLKSINKYLPRKKIIGIAGAFADKDIEKIFETLAPAFDKIFTVEPDSPRALALEEITQKVIKYNNNVTPSPSVEKALKAAVYEAGKDSAIVVFGSFSIMKDAKTFLNIDLTPII